MKRSGCLNATAHLSRGLFVLMWACGAHGQLAKDSDPSRPQPFPGVEFASDTSFTIQDERPDAAVSPEVKTSDVPTAQGRNGIDVDGIDVDGIDLDEIDLRQTVREAAATRQRALRQMSGLSPQISALFDEALDRAESLDSHDGQNKLAELPPTLADLPEEHATNTFSRLEERLDDLEQVLKQPRACAELPTQEPEVPPEAPPVAKVEPPLLPDGPEVLPPPSYSELTENAKRQEADQQETSGQPNEHVVEAIAITDSPVDRMSLANNLYGAGEYELALKGYLELDNSNTLPPQEKVWIQYQIGSCHQHLGDTSAAQRSLRRVAAVEQQSPWGKHSRWWLHTNERTNRLQSEIEQFQLEMTQFEGKTNEPAEP